MSELSKLIDGAKDTLNKKFNQAKPALIKDLNREIDKQVKLAGKPSEFVEKSLITLVKKANIFGAASVIVTTLIASQDFSKFDDIADLEDRATAIKTQIANRINGARL